MLAKIKGNEQDDAVLDNIVLYQLFTTLKIKQDRLRGLASFRVIVGLSLKQTRKSGVKAYLNLLSGR